MFLEIKSGSGTICFYITITRDESRCCCMKPTGSETKCFYMNTSIAPKQHNLE